MISDHTDPRYLAAGCTSGGERSRRQRSRSLRREVRRRREQSAGPHFGSGVTLSESFRLLTMLNPDAEEAAAASEDGREKAERVARYKEERRRQLANQIANRISQSVASSSSDEDSIDQR